MDAPNAGQHTGEYTPGRANAALQVRRRLLSCFYFHSAAGGKGWAGMGHAKSLYLGCWATDGTQGASFLSLALFHRWPLVPSYLGESEGRPAMCVFFLPNLSVCATLFVVPRFDLSHRMGANAGGSGENFIFRGRWCVFLLLEATELRQALNRPSTIPHLHSRNKFPQCFLLPG